MSETPRTDELFAKRHALDAFAPWTLCMAMEIELKDAYERLAASDQKWERRLIAALGGHADSKLWGDDGLIAATWRCVKGYEKIEKELAEAKAEAEKWEKLHDQDTEHLASLQKRDNYGPTETLNETAMRLSCEIAEAKESWRFSSICRELKHQRDTLAEALLPLLAMTVAMLKNDTKTLHSEITITDKKTGNQTSMKAIELIENADAAYRSLKGGSHE